MRKSRRDRFVRNFRLKPCHLPQRTCVLSSSIIFLGHSYLAAESPCDLANSQEVLKLSHATKTLGMDCQFGIILILVTRHNFTGIVSSIADHRITCFLGTALTEQGVQISPNHLFELMASHGICRMPFSHQASHCQLLGIWLLACPCLMNRSPSHTEPPSTTMSTPPLIRFP